MFSVFRISDQVLGECLKEIDSEMDEISEVIVHRVCKSEFAVPDPSVVAEQVAAERLHDRMEMERIVGDSHGLDAADQERIDLDKAEQGRVSRSRGSSMMAQDRLEKTQEERDQYQQHNIPEFGEDYDRKIEETPRDDSNTDYDKEEFSPRVERFETLADIEDLQPVETEIHTERDSEQIIGSVAYDQSRTYDQSRSEIWNAENYSHSEARQSMTRGVARDDDYEDDYEDEEEEDDVEEVSPIDTDDLEYSTDDT